MDKQIFQPPALINLNKSASSANEFDTKYSRLNLFSPSDKSNKGRKIDNFSQIHVSTTKNSKNYIKFPSNIDFLVQETRSVGHLEQDACFDIQYNLSPNKKQLMMKNSNQIRTRQSKNPNKKGRQYSIGRTIPNKKKGKSKLERKRRNQMRITNKSESKKSIGKGKRGNWLKKSKSNCGKQFSHKLMKSVKQYKTQELSSSKAIMVEELIKTNLRRVSEKKRKSKQRQIILEQQQRIKALEIERMNGKIRRMNHKSTRKRKKVHQLRNTFYFRKEKHIKLNLEKYMKNPPKIGGPITKTQRRREMGLEFLNSMETERIKKIVQKDQEKLKKNLRMEGIPKIMISKQDFKRQKGVAEFVKNTRKRVNSPLYFKSDVEKKRTKKRDMMRKLKTLIKKKSQKKHEKRNKRHTQAMLNIELSSNKDLAENELFERDFQFFNYKHKELCHKYRHIIEKHKKRNKKSSPKIFKKVKTKNTKKKRKKHKKKKDITKQIVKKLTPYAEKRVQKVTRLKKEKESFSVIKETRTDEEDDSPDILDRFSSSSEDPNQNTIRIHSTEKTDFNPEEERKQKVLDFQENKAATTIQKLFKGWLVRQGIKEWKEYIRAQEEESSDRLYISSEHSNKEISVFKDVPEAENQTNIFIDDHSNDVVLIEKHGKKAKLASLNLSKAGKELKDEGVQTSFKNNTNNSLAQETGMSPIKFQVECIDLDKINSSKKEKERLEHLAKQEYRKWTRMRNMIQSIENRLGSKAAYEVQELFHQMEAYAENSKKTLKDTFLYNETCLSAQLSEIRVLRSNNEEPPTEQGKSSNMIKDSNNQMVLINNSVKDKIPMLQYINGNLEDSMSKVKLEGEGKLSNSSKIKFRKNRQTDDRWVDGNSKNSLTLSPTSSHINSKHLAGSLNFIKKSGKRSSRELNSDRHLLNFIENDFKNNSLEQRKEEDRINIIHNLIPDEGEVECSTNSLRDRLEELDNHSLEEVNEGAECHYDQDLTSFSRQEEEEEQSDMKEEIPKEQKAKEEIEKEVKSSTELDPNGSVEESLEPEQETVLPIKLISDPKTGENGTIEDTEEELEEGEEESNANLQNFVENSKVDMAWLISELVENGEGNLELQDAENNSEIEENNELDKLKSGRVGFLSEAVTDLIISELVEDFSEDPFWNKKLSEEGERLFKEKEESDAETVYGIRTNYNAVNEYCNLLIKFIFDNFGDQILERLNRDTPMNRPKELQVLWERDEKQEDDKTRNHWEEFESEVLEKEIEVEVPHPSDELVLSLKVFNVLEDEILSNYQHMNILPELFEMQRIYHRAIFDCLNEALSYPMIINEEGYIRKLVYGKMEYTRILSKEDLMEKLQYCKDIVLEWSSLLCGIIRDKEDSMMGNIRFMEPDVINQLREERLFRFLSLEALEKENTWINYEKEEVRALIDCSDHIFEDIMDELILDLYKIDKKRS